MGQATALVIRGSGLSREGELESQSRTTQFGTLLARSATISKVTQTRSPAGAQTHRAGAGDAGTTYCVHIVMDSFWGVCCGHTPVVARPESEGLV